MEILKPKHNDIAHIDFGNKTRRIIYGLVSIPVLALSMAGIGGCTYITFDNQYSHFPVGSDAQLRFGWGAIGVKTNAGRHIRELQFNHQENRLINGQWQLVDLGPAIVESYIPLRSSRRVSQLIGIDP